MKTDRFLICRYLSFCSAMIIMLVIFIMSAKESTESSEASGNIIEFFAKIFNKNFSEMTSQQQVGYVDSFQFLVRKTAHFIVYTLLGFAMSVGMLTYKNLNLFIRILIALFVSIIYAATDELHQLFVPGRSCELRDWLIDSSGAFLGCLLVIGLYYILKS